MKFYGKKPIWGYYIIIIFICSFIIGILFLRRNLYIQILYLSLLFPFLYIWYKFIINYEIKKGYLEITGGVVGRKYIKIKNIIYIDILCRRKYKEFRKKLYLNNIRICFMGDMFSRKIITVFIENNGIEVIAITPKKEKEFIKYVNTYWDSLIKINNIEEIIKYINNNSQLNK